MFLNILVIVLYYQNKPAKVQEKCVHVCKLDMKETLAGTLCEFVSECDFLFRVCGCCVV